MDNDVTKKRLRAFARSGRAVVLRFVGWLLAPIMRYVAKYGYGVDSCLAHGFLPLPVHYYSPVPDVADLNRRRVWNKKSDLAGIDFRTDAQVRLLIELGARFGAECNFPDQPTADESEFHLANDNFSFGCAAALHSMIRRSRPSRVIEIGSGNSSKVIARALNMNECNGVSSADYLIIDPYPTTLTRERLAGVSRVIPERVELLNPSIFDELCENDVLFVDSGHTVRIGGDVNFLFLDVLPRLAPGVVVHIHDVNLPFEYEREYAAGQPGTFRRLWTESYLLQAFLACNRDFEILLAMRYLMVEHADEFGRAFPLYTPARQKSLSSSFWMKRVHTSQLHPA